MFTDATGAHRSPWFAVAIACFIALALMTIGMLTTYGIPRAFVGPRFSLAGAIALAALPSLAYGVVRAPLVWPLALYIVLIPFENVLAVSQSTTLARLLGIICGLVIVGGLLARRKIVFPAVTVFLWALVIVWMSATLMWDKYDSVVPSQLWQIVQLFGLYAAVALYPARYSDLRSLLVAVSAGGLAATIYGIYLFTSTGVGANATQVVGNRLWIHNGEGQIDPNHFAAALQLPFALMLVSALRAKTAFGKVLFSSGTLLVLTGILLAASRGAIVAAGFAILYLIWRLRAYLQLGLIAAAAGAVSLLTPAVWARFADPTQAEGAGRVGIWKVGLLAAGHHWLAGSGIGSFPSSYNEAFLSVYQATNEGWSRASHNVILGTSVELGVIGLLLVLAAWFANFKALSDIRPGNPCYGTRIALETAIVALSVESVFLDILLFKYVWLAFTLVCVARQAARSQENRVTATS